MDYLKLFESYNNSEYKIKEICHQYGILNWTLNSDGLVDVGGAVILNKNHLSKFPIPFGEVTRHFYCSGNKLTSLEGAPKNVGGCFNCHDNNLTSLEGRPNRVGDYFAFSENKITSLKDIPQFIGGSLYCYSNKLTSLEGAPTIINGDFICFDNDLTSLDGAPELIRGDFNLSSNKIMDLYNFPIIVTGKISLRGNPKIEAILDILERSQLDLLESINLLNEVDVWVRGDLKLRKAKFNYALSEMGLEPVYSIPHWELV